MRKAEVQAYPLRWPDGWPRTRSRQTSHPFKGRTYGEVTFDRARRGLADELERLRAQNIVLSTNVPLRIDGLPHAGAAGRRMEDPGVAVYFTLKGKQMVMAQDAYADVAANMRSLSLAVEAIRSLERHGGGAMMERAFDGFAALPAPDGVKPKRPWWSVLNYSADPDERLDLTADEVQARWRALAKKRHPDAGGSDELMAELNEARDQAVLELGG